MTESQINAEVVKVMKREPRTAAEKAFRDWLIQWRAKVAKEKGE
jgi:hypothetical protein